MSKYVLYRNDYMRGCQMHSIDPNMYKNHIQTNAVRSEILIENSSEL